jgi:hypothetical protein
MTTTTTTTTLSRDTAVYDIYVGLLRIGYTRLGAIRAMRLAGMSLFDGKRAMDIHDGKLAWERTA